MYSGGVTSPEVIVDAPLSPQVHKHEHNSIAIIAAVNLFKSCFLPLPFYFLFPKVLS